MIPHLPFLLFAAAETPPPQGSGTMKGYLARPAKGGRFPVVFVYTEIFGVHEHIKDVCRRFAKAGPDAPAAPPTERTDDPVLSLV